MLFKNPKLGLFWFVGSENPELPNLMLVEEAEVVSEEVLLVVCFSPKLIEDVNGVVVVRVPAAATRLENFVLGSSLVAVVPGR